MSNMNYNHFIVEKFKTLEKLKDLLELEDLPDYTSNSNNIFLPFLFHTGKIFSDIGNMLVEQAEYELKTIEFTDEEKKRILEAIAPGITT